MPVCRGPHRFFGPTSADRWGFRCDRRNGDIVADGMRFSWRHHFGPTVATIGLLLGASILALLAAPAAAQTVTAQKAPAQNWLADRLPIATSGVSNVAALTDGEAPEEGGFWLSGETSRLRSGVSYAVWDLGQVRKVRCLALQGDNNDTYRIDGSLEGDRFFPIWMATPRPDPGLRLRTGRVVASTRFVRLTARGGDGLFSVGELQILDACAKPWTPEIAYVPGPLIESRVRVVIWLAAGALLLFVLLHNHRNTKKTIWLAAAPLLVMAVARDDFAALLPLFSAYNNPSLASLESLISGLIAFSLAALALKEMAGDRQTPHRHVRTGILGVLMAAAMANFFHFGVGQFDRTDAHRPTFANLEHAQQAVLPAKHFPEIGADGLHEALVAAHLHRTGESLADNASATFRDLKTDQVQTIGNSNLNPQALRSRFAPERWDQFVSDSGLLAAMTDRSFLPDLSAPATKASPLWLSVVHQLYRNAPLSEANLLWLAYLDVVLLAGTLLLVAFSFGFRASATCAILYCVLPAPLRDTVVPNAAGGLLQSGWLALLVASVCLLHQTRYRLGGLLLGLALALKPQLIVGAALLAAPTVWHVLDGWRMHGQRPSSTQLWQTRRPSLLTLLGLIAGVALAGAVGTATLGVSAWLNWLATWSFWGEPSAARVGLQALLFDEPLAGAWANGLVLALLFVAAKGRRPGQIILLGVAALPLLFHLQPVDVLALAFLPLAPLAFFRSRFGPVTFRAPSPVPGPGPLASQTGDGANGSHARIVAALALMASAAPFFQSYGRSDLVIQSALLVGVCGLGLLAAARAGWRTGQQP